MEEHDEFRKEFKYYKANKPPPSLDNVINILNEDVKYDKVLKNVSGTLSLEENDRTHILGLIPTKKWQIYEFKTNPGLLYITNPFTSLGQRFWIRKCLENYTKKPNRTNIDIELALNDWWKKCYENGACDTKLQKKMRWTTLGYHHNWDTKVYSESNKDQFPLELSEMCNVIAEVLGYKCFKPQAAIVNYYHMDSTLSAHTDHSEINLEAPLFSFSFGQSAIFLIGGTRKSVKPTAIMLNSGDIVIMSKEARLCFHAVPKILPTPQTPWNHNCAPMNAYTCKMKYIENADSLQKEINENIDNESWSKFNEYIMGSRININVRQVLNDGTDSI